MNKIKKIFTYLLSLLGAAGVGLQNYMAVMALSNGIAGAAIAASKTGMGFLQGIAVAFGGVCGGVINLFINIGLLEDFLERITKKKRPQLSGWKWFSYWFGSGVFVTTGILFGLTAFAFGPVGALAALGIAAGIFVALIMTVQELETWLARFDEEDKNEKKSIKALFIEWKNSLTKGKILGFVIAAGNVIALSLLFTLGLATFLTGVGAPILPAMISAFVVAFTAGAFTEFYFYHSFLGKFCENMSEKWQAFKNSTWPVLGGILSGINASVNGVLTYIGITMLFVMLAGAGVAVPPLGVVIAGAVIAALFAATASFILGIDFWTKNIKKITDYFTSKKDNDTQKTPNEPESPSTTQALLATENKNAKAVITTSVSAEYETITVEISKPTPAANMTLHGNSIFSPVFQRPNQPVAALTVSP